MPPVARGEVLELEVTGLATGGRGLAKLDRYVVFVEGALPGDRVRARITRSKGRYAESVAVERLSAGPDRVEARCAHVSVCGGCRFQDYDYAAQLLHKQQAIRDSMTHLAALDIPVREVRPSSDIFHYRNKMEFSFGAAEDGRVSLGLHHRGRFDTIFNLSECHICPPAMNRTVEVLRALARRDGLPAYDLRSHEGELRFVALRESRATGELLVNLVSAEPRVDVFGSWALELAREVPSLRGFVFSLHRGQAQAVQAESWQLLWGEDRIVERLNGLEFEISPWSFFQTNSAQAEVLYREALAAAELVPEDRVLDLYCGTGTLTLTFARECAAAWGVETVEEAVRDAVRNAERNFGRGMRTTAARAPGAVAPAVSASSEPGQLGAPDVRFFAADARPWLRLGGAKELEPTVVVVDPPRAGLHPRVIDRVCELRPRRVVYVSCNPTTLARDLAHFARLGYRAPWIQPVDMFPHTDHVECVAALEPGEPPPA
ncbi:MAG: 23S rRNA (uracil(1939)-C(5))-methyltransferase RlmD [Candidatus Eisenbacteria bacterium]|nr:23S rRNA (uracil(1939)-C(5))-methyltransferase RlmD [Candidatus Eisenbacteria bacterium]